MHNVLRRAGFGAIAATMALGVVACGDDSEPDETGSAPEATTTTTSAPEETTTSTATDGGDEGTSGEVIEVTGVDYAFEGVPETMPAGSVISFTNGSDVEAHEFVAIRLPDDETRPVSELVTLPDEELGEIVNTEPTVVILAAPGETDTFIPVGDGSFTEPGRYAVVCFIPLGADPAVVLDPEAEGPPEGTAPPHASQGMVAELTVE